MWCTPTPPSKSPTGFCRATSKVMMTRWYSLHAISGVAMNNRVNGLSQQYAAVLQSYLAVEQETELQQAYELGREAIALGLGVFYIARIHQHALAACLSPILSPEKRTRTLSG